MFKNLEQIFYEFKQNTTFFMMKNRMDEKLMILTLHIFVMLVISDFISIDHIKNQLLAFISFFYFLNDQQQSVVNDY
jgi:hypothetical protein